MKTLSGFMENNEDCENLRNALYKIKSDFVKRFEGDSRNIDEDLDEILIIKTLKNDTYRIFVNIDVFDRWIAYAQHIGSDYSFDYFHSLKRFYTESILIELGEYSVEIENIDDLRAVVYQ